MVACLHGAGSTCLPSQGPLPLERSMEGETTWAGECESASEQGDDDQEELAYDQDNL